MSVADNFQIAYTQDGIAYQTKSFTETGSARLLFNGSIAGSTTDQLWNIVATKSKINSIYIYSDVALTFETNSGSGPTDTLAIPAGIPVLWSVDWPVTCPITANITAGIFITNAGSTAANLVVAINLDA